MSDTVSTAESKLPKEISAEKGLVNVQIDGEDRSVYNAIEPDRGDHNRLYGFTTGTIEIARSEAGVDG